MADQHRGVVIGTTAMGLFLILWELVVRLGIVPPLFLSSPTDILVALWEWIQDGRFWRDLSATGFAFITGYALSVLFGIGLGLLIGWSSFMYYALNPFISALYATPRVALLPLLVIWFGIGVWSKVLMVSLGAFFPICVNTLAGVKSTDSSLVKAARTFGARDPFIFRTIVLPGSVPFILAGLRLGVGRGLLSVIVAEFYISAMGLGHFIAEAGDRFLVSNVFAGVLVVALIGVAAMSALSRLEDRYDKWRPSALAKE